MNKLLVSYRDEWNFFHERLARTFFLLCGLFVIVMLIALLFFCLEPAAAKEIVRQFSKRYGDALQYSQVRLLFYILAGNLLAAFVTILLGLIPIPIFSMLPLLKNSFESAALICVSGAIPSQTIAAAILPHGIIEIPAILIATTLGVQLSRSRMQRRRRMLAVDSLEEEAADSTGFSRALRSYALIIIPALLFAALIETFVTPLIMSMAMN